MNFLEAMHVLVDSYTEDDELVGFKIHAIPTHFNRWSDEDRSKAWEEIRRIIKKPYKGLEQ